MQVPRETRGAVELFGASLELATAYAEALASTGVEHGLIGPREVPRLWERHLLNCVALGELIPSGAELADLGSGAGLPGIPLAIARPDLSVHLVEPLLRRVSWLREVVTMLGLTNVEIIRARAAAVAESRQMFDVVSARAVAPLPTLLGWCLPLVRPGGLLLAMKGEGAYEELVASEPQLEKLRAREWAVTLCGGAILDQPTTVVQVTAGEAPRQQLVVKGSKNKAKGGSQRSQRRPAPQPRSGGGSTSRRPAGQ